MRSANINGFMVGFTASIMFYAIAASYSLGAYLIKNNLYGVTLQNILIVFNCLTFGAQSIGKFL